MLNFVNMFFPDIVIPNDFPDQISLKALRSNKLILQLI
jgi:hypothetical protein